MGKRGLFGFFVLMYIFNSCNTAFIPDDLPNKKTIFVATDPSFNFTDVKYYEIADSIAIINNDSAAVSFFSDSIDYILQEFKLEMNTKKYIEMSWHFSQIPQFLVTISYMNPEEVQKYIHQKTWFNQWIDYKWDNLHYNSINFFEGPRYMEIPDPYLLSYGNLVIEFLTVNYSEKSFDSILFSVVNCKNENGDICLNTIKRNIHLFIQSVNNLYSNADYVW